MVVRFPLSDHGASPDADDFHKIVVSSDDDMLWGVTLTPSTLAVPNPPGGASIAFTLANLLIDPKECVKQQIHFQSPDALLPIFKPEPIVLLFQYGPFCPADTWLVHGVNFTNVISVRCPSLSQVSLHKESDMGADVDVRYLSHPYPVAFAHFDPQTAKVDWEAIGSLLENPTRFATLLNAQKKKVAPGSSTGGSDAVADADKVKKKAVFTLSDTFRFRYEYHYSDDSNPGTDKSTPAPTAASDMQCVKFAGTYSEAVQPTDSDALGNNMTESQLVVQIDEAWSMRWQTIDPPNNASA